MDELYTHDITNRKFVKSEFKEWCDQYLLQDKTNVNHESEEAMDALYWTGGIPYELDLLWKQPTNTLSSKTLLYREKRLRDFCDTLSNRNRDNVIECIVRMALELSPPDDLEGMDQQLFVIALDQNNQKVITSMNPVARRALFVYYGASLTTSLNFVAKVVLQGRKYNNDLKGKISEKYITYNAVFSGLAYFLFW